MDLEGIVCKRKDSPYKVTDKPYRYWIQVKNSRYSQMEVSFIASRCRDIDPADGDWLISFFQITGRRR